MTKEEKKIIEKLLRELQMILVDDDYIPIYSAKRINNKIIAIQNILKTVKVK